MSNISRGSVLLIGNGEDQFKMIFKDAIEAGSKVQGPLMDEGGGMCTVPTTEVVQVLKPTAKSLKCLAEAESRSVIHEKVVSIANKTKTPATKVQKTAKERHYRAKNGPTVIDRAIAIAKANPNASRKDLIALFVSELGMTAAGASTYATNARKAASKDA